MCGLEAPHVKIEVAISLIIVLNEIRDTGSAANGF